MLVFKNWNLKMEDLAMKKMITMLALNLIFFGFISFGFASGLSIRLFDNSEIEVEMNSQILKNASSYTISNLDAGYHFLKVFRIRYNNQNGMTTRKLFFSRSIYISSNTFLETMIDRNKNLVILSETSTNSHNSGNSNNYHGGNNNGYYGGNNNGGTYGTHYGSSHGNQYGGNYGGSYGNNYGGGYGNSYGNSNGNYCYSMGDYEFNMLKNTIENQSFDSSKLETAKSALYKNKITSRQVLELVKMLTFESSKLELAKFAYDRTVDQGNYFVVNNAFTFSSSIDELNRYIRGQ